MTRQMGIGPWAGRSIAEKQLGKQNLLRPQSIYAFSSTRLDVVAIVL
jgi:hypothetical protein